MSSHSLTATTTESRALDLLGSGALPGQVASALGVDPSYISQLLAQESFSSAVTELRYKSLLKHNARDNTLDELEDKLIKKMSDLIPMMYKPSEIIHAFTRINAAKRRGSSAPETIIQQNTVIQLNLPTQIVQHFQVNALNQVIKTGQQDLITVQSGRMPTLLASKELNHVKELAERSQAA